MRGLHHHREAELTTHRLRLGPAHEPGGRGDARAEEQFLGNELVHGEGAAQRPAPCVGDVDEVEQRLQATVLAGPAVQPDEYHLDVPRLRQLVESASQRSAR